MLYPLSYEGGVRGLPAASSEQNHRWDVSVLATLEGIEPSTV